MFNKIKESTTNIWSQICVPELNPALSLSCSACAEIQHSRIFQQQISIFDSGHFYVCGENGFSFLHVYVSDQKNSDL